MTRGRKFQLSCAASSHSSDGTSVGNQTCSMSIITFTNWELWDAGSWKPLYRVGYCKGINRKTVLVLMSSINLDRKCQFQFSQMSACPWQLDRFKNATVDFKICFQIFQQNNPTGNSDLKSHNNCIDSCSFKTKGKGLMNTLNNICKIYLQSLWLWCTLAFLHFSEPK